MAETEIKTENGTPDIPAKKKYVSDDDLYRRSSQYQVWSYTEQELEELKMQTNENGRIAALKKFDEAAALLKQEKPEVFAAHGSELSADIAGTITYEEEQKYLFYFSQQIIQICSHFNMPTQVRATAVSFFKRFYVVNSVMEYKPRNVLYTIVFLAAKLENYFISIESFCSRLPKTKPSDILDLEFIVLLSLKFTLLVHHPYRPLYGFFLDLQLVLLRPEPIMKEITIDTIGGLYDLAKKWLNDEALLSEVSFLFTPPQIALAAMYDTDQKVTDTYLRKKFLNEDPKTLQMIKEEKRERRKREKLEENGDVKTESDSGVKKEENDEVKSEEIKVESEEAGKEEKDQKSSEQEQYEVLMRTIKKCIEVAKTKVETSREESTKIDEKCFFALNPTKLLKKRIKALEN